VAEGNEEASWVSELSEWVSNCFGESGDVLLRPSFGRNVFNEVVGGCEAVLFVEGWLGCDGGFRFATRDVEEGGHLYLFDFILGDVHAAVGSEERDIRSASEGVGEAMVGARDGVAVSVVDVLARVSVAVLEEVVVDIVGSFDNFRIS